MTLRLRPTAPIAADAVLVGDPGRALLLAQELLTEPKMSNHARGLWGYSGETPGGRALTIQSTGMGGPSAALVLADLAELGVRRAVRVGTCTALAPEPEPGELLAALEASPGRDGTRGEAALADVRLTAALRRELGGGVSIRPAIVTSLDHWGQGEQLAVAAYEAGDVFDMQTATLLARGEQLGVAVAAILIVAESARGEVADDEVLAASAKRAGIGAAAALGLAEA
jgi:uridine phosphorylase